uniref:Uncharacterized protein n=1 Tax=viral metagenome TaxID=1070528 RepID=A0A6C0DMZ1_9ZZZZ
MALVGSFCNCIKKVRKTVKLRNKRGSKEGAAIGICVKSVLQSRRKTLKRFRCNGRKPFLKTKPL